MPKFRGLPRGKRPDYFGPKQHRYNTPRTVGDWETRPSRGNRKWSFFLRGKSEQGLRFQIDDPIAVRKYRSFRRLWCRSLKTDPIPFTPVFDDGQARSWRFLSPDSDTGYWEVIAYPGDNSRAEWCEGQLQDNSITYIDDAGVLRVINVRGPIRYEYENDPSDIPNNQCEYSEQCRVVAEVQYWADTSSLLNEPGNIIDLPNVDPNEPSFFSVIAYFDLGPCEGPISTLTIRTEQQGEDIPDPAPGLYYVYSNPNYITTFSGCPTTPMYVFYATYQNETVNSSGVYYGGVCGSYYRHTVNPSPSGYSTSLDTTTIRSGNLDWRQQYSSGPNNTWNYVGAFIGNEPQGEEGRGSGDWMIYVDRDGVEIFSDGPFSRDPAGWWFSRQKQVSYYNCKKIIEGNPSCTLVVYSGDTEISRVTREDGTCPVVPPINDGGGNRLPTPGIRCTPVSYPGDPYYETIWNEGEYTEPTSEYYYTCTCPYYSGQITSLSDPLDANRSFGSGAPYFRYQQRVCKHIMAAMRVNGDLTDADIPYDEQIESQSYEGLDTRRYLETNPFIIPLQTCTPEYVDELMEELEMEAESLINSRTGMTWHDWDQSDKFGKWGDNWDSASKF